MLPLAADENLNNNIVRGVRLRSPAIDVVTVQDAGLSGADDPTVLQWAADAGRALLTHDVSTMTAHAELRIAAGLAMPGLFQVSRSVPIGVAIEDILRIAECSLDGEWEDQIRYLPLS